ERPHERDAGRDPSGGVRGLPVSRARAVGPHPSARSPRRLASPVMRTRALRKRRNTGHAGINALFAKAHSADWDIENDVDWSVQIDPEDALVAHEWAAYGRTPTFQAPPERVKAHATRRALGRMLN